MNLQKIPISEINPAPYNPRKDLKPGDIEYKKIARSLNEFGLVEPLVWNQRTGNLVGGHQRLKVLIQRGDKEVDVSVVDLDQEKEKALNITLNKIQGDWDEEKLRELISEMSISDIELSGFDLSEMEKLNPPEKQEYSIDDFIFTDVSVPCWFVIRADLLEYDKIKDYLLKLPAAGLHIEDSQEGKYDRQHEPSS